MSETMTDTLPSSMTVDVEPTREHLAEQLFVAERDLAQAKRAILQLEAERDEAKTDLKTALKQRDNADMSFRAASDERDALKQQLAEAKQTGLFPHAKEVRQSIYRETAEVARLKAELDGWNRSRPSAFGQNVALSSTPLDGANGPGPVEWARTFDEQIAKLQGAPRTHPKKPRPDLLPAESLIEAGWCMAGGLERDDEDGQPWYATAPRAEARRKYRRSLLRHVLSWYAGEHVDSDSRRSPLAHIICNAAILFWLERRK